LAVETEESKTESQSSRRTLTVRKNQLKVWLAISFRSLGKHAILQHRLHVGWTESTAKQMVMKLVNVIRQWNSSSWWQEMHLQRASEGEYQVESMRVSIKSRNITTEYQVETIQLTIYLIIWVIPLGTWAWLLGHDTELIDRIDMRALGSTLPGYEFVKCSWFRGQLLTNSHKCHGNKLVTYSFYCESTCTIYHNIFQFDSCSSPVARTGGGLRDCDAIHFRDGSASLALVAPKTWCIRALGALERLILF